jgi:hypothetical protein
VRSICVYTTSWCDALKSVETRLCPGVHYAKAALFTAIASMLATFNFSLAKDENGNDIVPLAESENQII